MEIIRTYPHNSKLPPLSTAIGFYDGLHLAHQQVINSAVRSSYKSAVITFMNHPLSIIAPEIAPKLIVRRKDAIQMFEEVGIDYLFIFDFTQNMMDLSPEAFIRKFIYGLNVKEVNVGYNFTFGFQAEGDRNTLKKYSEAFGYGIKVVEPILLSGNVISSSRIRQFIAQGDMQQAAAYLGKYYFIRNKVFQGKQKGSEFGFKTANMNIPHNMQRPKSGVYQTQTIIDGITYKSITNIGNNPTIGTDDFRAETHILDFNQMLYGQEIKVEFVKFMREECKFENIEALKKQVLTDIAYVKGQA